MCVSGRRGAACGAHPILGVSVAGGVLHVVSRSGQKRLWHVARASGNFSKESRQMHLQEVDEVASLDQTSGENSCELVSEG